MRTLQRALFVLIGVAACDLGVTNTNNPDRDRLLRTPADVESLIGQLYQNFHNATIGGSNDGLNPQLLVSGMESFSGLGNFQMGVRAAVPRANPHVDNNRGNPGEAGNLRDFQRLSTTARTASDALRRMATPGFTIGSAARDQRAKAFAQFVLGLTLGHLAMVYDSVAWVGPADDPNQLLPPLRGYNEGITEALRLLDEAIATVNADATQFGSLTGTWINGNTPNAAAFVRIIRSYKARMRAAVARTLAEREGVDWNAVIGDAEAGITADLNIAMDPGQGWDMVWVIQQYLFGAWHQMWQFMVGFGDVSGAYDSWLATQPVSSRKPFTVVTPDRRFPQGTTRTAQRETSPPVPTAGLYFRNRREGDSSGDPLGFSEYDFYRFQAFFNAQRIGSYPVMTVPEMKLLAAEGYIRTNRVSTAGPLIDFSRVARGGLPQVTGISNLTDPVPGGSSCVPRVPQPPTFNSAACGNILEALKWEKRLETAFIGYGSWYFDSRGWGDLPAGTALHWPVPWQEMDGREQAFYHMPSPPGTLPGAATGTYGL